MSKKHKIFWTSLALADLEEMRRYVSREAQEAAKRLAIRILKSVEMLEKHPLAGRLVPEFKNRPHDEFRELLVPPYRIIYEVQESKVFVVRVWHGRRDLFAAADTDENAIS